jgi:hypothetical protein
MTYRNLITKLLNLSDDELDLDVTIYDKQEDEYYYVDDVIIAPNDGVLDKNHPVLLLDCPLY